MVIRRRTPSRKRTAVRRTPNRRRTEGLKRKAPASKTKSAKKRKASPKKTVTTTVRKHLQGYLDPFSITGGAKIPDGACMQSLPLTHKVVKEMNFPPVTPAAGNVDREDGTFGAAGSAQPADGTGHIVLIPGLQCGLYWNQDKGGMENEQGNYFTFSTDSWIDVKAPTPVSDFLYPINISSGGGISRWRTVSQALKLTLLNTQEQNDGWFECVRTTYKPRMTDWKIISPGGNHTFNEEWITTGQDAFFGPDDNLIDYLETKNLAEHLSYKAGSLKDIHKCQFNLMPYSKTNEFVELQENYKITEDEALLPIPNQPDGDAWLQTFDLNNGAGSSKDIYNSFMDTNHDIVLIKIHPGSSGSKLLAELAVNQEVVYDVDSVLSKHMTTTDIDEKAFKQAQDIKHASNQGAFMVTG